MRTVALLMNVSLDGYVEAPGHDISGFTQEYEAFDPEDSSVDTFLFGHTTYEMMKFWTTPQAHELLPDIAKVMNETPKIVASHAPFDPEWDSVTVFSGDDVVEQVRRLKAQAGKDIMIMGSNTLCVSLMQAGLIDVFMIQVNPVVFGAGTSLFAGLPEKASLTLTQSQQFKSGVMLLTYVPATL